ncbi:iron-sulfur cluster assembly scaffold protein [Desulfoluna sp.]|uniref:iron-sulfur cluster assembly scaffold protein n=1 Tax=Desulfoluna sp. TaxID=2045199 RepID=UPI0026023A8C|nr:iron-sulfur cluster assembly scaffold protein [Desulfoluna sp.]
MGDLDTFLDNLQEEIFDEAKASFGEKGYERWRNPRFQGKMESADAFASLTGSCGDTMEIYLKFSGNRVTEASYFTNGCASSSLCGSFASELAIGRDPDELAEITGELILETVGKLPDEDTHCSGLAASTLRDALTCYMKKTLDQDGASDV